VALTVVAIRTIFDNLFYYNFFKPREI